MYLWCHLRWIGHKPMRDQVLMLDGWEVRSYTNIPSPRQPLVSECGTRGPACLDRSALHWTRRFLPLPTWWLFCLCTWIHKSASQQTRSKQGVLPQVLGRSLELNFLRAKQVRTWQRCCTLWLIVSVATFCAAWIWGATEVSLQTLRLLRCPLGDMNFTRVWWQYSRLLSTWWIKFVGASLLTSNRCLQLVSSDYVKFFVSFLETSNPFSVHYVLVHPRHRAILWASRWMKQDFQLAS